MKQVRQYADHLRLTLLRNQTEHVIHQAQIDKPTYLDYTHDILEQEVLQRQRTDLDRRIKGTRKISGDKLVLLPKKKYNWKKK